MRFEKVNFGRYGALQKYIFLNFKKCVLNFNKTPLGLVRFARCAQISDESELCTMNTKASFQKEKKLIKNINQ